MFEKKLDCALVLKGNLERYRVLEFSLAILLLE